MSIPSPVVVPIEQASVVELASGVRLRPLVGRGVKATAIFTGVVEIDPGCQLPYHTHPCDEAITALAGSPAVEVEGRRYRLGRLDTALAPTGAAHTVLNPGTELARIHVAFAADFPARTLIETKFEMVETIEAPAGASEKLRRAPAGRQAEGFDLFRGQGFRGRYIVVDPMATSIQQADERDVSLAVVAGAVAFQCGDLAAELALHDGFYLPPGLAASLTPRNGAATILRIEAH